MGDFPVLTFLLGLIPAAGLVLGFISLIKKKHEKKRKKDGIKEFQFFGNEQNLLTGELETLYNKLEACYRTIREIDIKIDSLMENASLFDEEDRQDDEIKIIIEKQNKIINYLSGYFDNYSSLYLKIFLEIMTGLYKKSDMAKIDAEKYIPKLKADADDAIQLLKKMLVYPKVPHEEIDEAIKKIEKEINNIKLSLITYHSNKLLSNISPVEDAHKRKKEEGYDDLLLLIDNLDDNYERFIHGRGA